MNDGPNHTLHPVAGVGLGADFVRTLARHGWAWALDALDKEGWVLPLAVEGKFELPSLSDRDTATARALDETAEAVTQLRSVAFDRGPGYLSFRLSTLAQLWRRTAPAPGRYTLRIASDGDSLFAVYEVRSIEMVLWSAAASILPFLSGQLFQGVPRALLFVWLGVVWGSHTANMLLAGRWFRRLLQGVLLDPLRLKFHGV